MKNLNSPNPRIVIFNFYCKGWFVIDSLLSIIILLVSLLFKDFFPNSHIDHAASTTLNGSLATASLTLAGFFFTVITVIMAFNSSSKSMGVRLFFNSQYGNLLKVFRNAVWLMLGLFIFFVLMGMLEPNIPHRCFVLINIFGLSMLILSTLRNFLIIHLVIDLIND